MTIERPKELINTFFIDFINPELMEIFRNIELVEKSGYGVPKIVREYGKGVFEINEGSVFLKIPFNKEVMEYLWTISNNRNGGNSTINSTIDSTIKLTKTESAILNILSSNSEITLEEICVSLNKEISTIKKNIRSLKEKKLVKRIGPNKGGHREIVDKVNNDV